MRLENSKYVLNFMILLPSIVLFFYVIPELYLVLYLVPFIILSLMPIIKRLIPSRFRKGFYYYVATVVLVLVLLTLLVKISVLPLVWYDRYFMIPLTEQTFLTIFISISTASIIEGILSESLNRAVSSLFVSILPLLDQVFAVFLTTNGLSYFSALGEAYSYQFISILALVFTGSTNIDGNSFPPPLSTFQSPLNNFVLVAMIISIIGFILYFILIKETKHRSEAVSLISMPILAGAVIGVITFLAIVELESLNLQLLGGSVAILATVIYMARSSPERRRSRRLKRSRVNSR
ncbi:MAG: hypothetical protein M1431_03390 [Candidatus Thermoplasmatota archaeon]|nr:hypothetical protein [Candidatus Thermoplasmatota archaeon]